MRLLFVYNADSGRLNAVADSLHKLLSPQTYQCKLCELTYSTFSEKAEWKEFRKERPEEMIFLHRDEFEKQFRSKWLASYEYPVILCIEGEQLTVLVGREEMENLEDIAALISLLNSHLDRG